MTIIYFPARNRKLERDSSGGASVFVALVDLGSLDCSDLQIADKDMWPTKSEET